MASLVSIINYNQAVELYCCADGSDLKLKFGCEIKCEWNVMKLDIHSLNDIIVQFLEYEYNSSN